ncbi:MAG: hypothetical protein V1743_05775 [Nanoarchaeota archaeon]
MDVKSIIRQIRDFQRQSVSLGEEANRLLETVRESLLSGAESTGDKIRDFVIVNQRSLSSEQEKQYRDLDARLRDHVGNQVLLVSQHSYQEPLIHYAFAPSERELMKTVEIKTEELGVLTGGLEFDLKNGMIVLPTARYAKRSEDKEWSLVEDAIRFHWLEMAGSSRPYPADACLDLLLRALPETERQTKSLQIFLGQEVAQYYYRTGNPDVAYTYALDLLCLEVPGDFRKAYEEHLRCQREHVFMDLKDLIQRIGRFKEKKENILNYAHLRQEKEKGIREQLQKAIKLDMHRIPLVIATRPGMSIDVPQYILGYCEEYRIEIPQ